MKLSWKLGVEVELMAPPGLSRLDLARRLAQETAGEVHRFWFAQSEPSKVPGQPVFHNLTPGFEVLDAQGLPLVRCVDDLTLQADLDRERPPLPGWFRLLSDERRILHLAQRHALTDAPLDQSLAPLAALFGRPVEPGPEGLRRITLASGEPVLMGAPLPGERERPCELVTPPIVSEHAARLEALLAPARALGFFAPAEGATHLHFDATPFEDARALRGLVNAWTAWGPALKVLLRTNPRCRRLGPWPRELSMVVNQGGFMALPWDQARAALSELPLTKYCDVNLRNLVAGSTEKHTVEFRVMPVYLHSEDLLAAAALFEALLRRAIDDPPRLRPPLPAQAADLVLLELPLDPETLGYWEARLN